MNTKRLNLEFLLMWTIIIVFSFFLLYPFWIAICTSLKNLNQFFETKVYVPVFLNGTIRPYIEAFSQLAIPMLHSLFIAIVTVTIAIFFGMVGGYVLTAARFKGASIVFAFVVFAIYIPVETRLLPLLKIIQLLGLYNTDFGVGLAVGSTMLPMSTILFRQFYVNIPKSFYEVAEIAGADHIQVFQMIIMPLSKIPIVTVTVLSFGIGWNAFMLPLIFTTGSYTDRPIGVALSSMHAAAVQDGTFNRMIAGALLTSIIPIIIYLFAQEYITSGFRSMGGVDK